MFYNLLVSEIKEEKPDIEDLALENPFEDVTEPSPFNTIFLEESSVQFLPEDDVESDLDCYPGVSRRVRYVMDISKGGHCSDCMVDFHQIRLHRDIVHRKKPERWCESCGRLFSKLNKYDGHRATHVEMNDSDRVECFICQTGQEDFEQLSSHLEKHKSLHIHLCTKCSKSFAFRANLEDHLMMEHGVESAPNIASPSASLGGDDASSKGGTTADDTSQPRVKSSTTASPLNDRSGTVDNKKENKGSRCVECHTDFPLIEAHRAIFHDGKPQRFCEICGRSFWQDDKLASHKTVHRKPAIKCHVCKRKDFDDASQFLKHLESHPELHIFPCRPCSTSFASSKYHDKHLRKCHRDLSRTTGGATHSDTIPSSVSNKSKNSEIPNGASLNTNKNKIIRVNNEEKETVPLVEKLILKKNDKNIQNKLASLESRMKSKLSDNSEGNSKTLRDKEQSRVENHSDHFTSSILEKSKSYKFKALIDKDNEILRSHIKTPDKADGHCKENKTDVTEQEIRKGSKKKLKSITDYLTKSSKSDLTTDAETKEVVGNDKSFDDSTGNISDKSKRSSKKFKKKHNNSTKDNSTEEIEGKKLSRSSKEIMKELNNDCLVNSSSDYKSLGTESKKIVDHDRLIVNRTDDTENICDKSDEKSKKKQKIDDFVDNIYVDDVLSGSAKKRLKEHSADELTGMPIKDNSQMLSGSEKKKLKGYSADEFKETLIKDNSQKSYLNDFKKSVTPGKISSPRKKLPINSQSMDYIETDIDEKTQPVAKSIESVGSNKISDNETSERNSMKDNKMSKKIDRCSIDSNPVKDGEKCLIKNEVSLRRDSFESCSNLKSNVKVDKNESPALSEDDNLINDGSNVSKKTKKRKRKNAKIVDNGEILNESKDIKPVKRRSDVSNLEEDNSIGNADEYKQNVSNVSDINIDHTCFVCGELFPHGKTPSVTQHWFDSHNDSSYACKICRKVYKKVIHLYYHGMRHKDKYPWKCKLCDAKLKNYSQFQDHITFVHRHAPLLNCDFCDRKFVFRTTLVNHVRTHDVNLKLICRHCSKRFVHKVHLQNHKKAHECVRCGVKLKCRTQYDDHYDKVHKREKIFNCDDCDLTFRYENLLKRHRTISHFDSTVKVAIYCKFCDFMTNTKHNLARHVRLKHK